MAMRVGKPWRDKSGRIHVMVYSSASAYGKPVWKQRLSSSKKVRFK